MGEPHYVHVSGIPNTFWNKKKVRYMQIYFNIMYLK